MNKFQLAEINIAKARFPIDSPEMAGFINNLDRVNALAERAGGFIWRLQDEAGNATAIVAFDDPSIIVNLSVWRSIEDLKNFAYKTLHTRFVGRRDEWFEPINRPYMALWWVPAGHRPTAAEGRKKLEDLYKNGPSPRVFSFKQTFDAPLIQPAG